MEKDGEIEVVTEFTKSLGQIAYEAYCKSTGGISLISKQLLPNWGMLNEEIKIAWEAAASAVSEEIGRS